MKFRLHYIFLLLFSIQLTAQENVDPNKWWNDLHNWKPGDPGWRNWIIISPGFLGPNALPVPEAKKGVLSEKIQFEISASNHFHNGDPTQDISGRFYMPFAKNKIAVELYGVGLEKFAFSEEIRNERYSRIENGKGIAVGDLYFSTLIQLARDRRFPNTLLRMATKTASGNQLEGARYTDSPGYYFDLSFSQIIKKTSTGFIKPFGMIGFYSWQTNDELNLQNDALLYGLGIDYNKRTWLFSTSWSGYSGYKNERDKPLQINLEILKSFKNKSFRVRYLHGIRHWEYKTVKFSYMWKWDKAE